MDEPIFSVPLADMEKFVELFKGYDSELDEQKKAWKDIVDAMDAARSGAVGKGGKNIQDIDAELMRLVKSADAVSSAFERMENSISKNSKASTKEIDSQTSALKNQEKQLSQLQKARTAFAGAASKSYSAAVGGAKTGYGLGQKVARLGGQGVHLAGDVAGLGLMGADLPVAGAMLAAGGLLALPALFLGGMAGLSGDIMRQFKEASGLGLSPGQLASWKANLSPVVDANFLPNVANAPFDLQKTGYLTQLGINPDAAQNESAAKLAEQIILSAKANYQNNKSQNSPGFQAFSAVTGGNYEEYRRIGNTPTAQLMKDFSHYQADIQKENISAQDAQKYEDVWSQLQNTEQQVLMAFAKALAPATQDVIEFSSFMGNEIASLVDSKTAMKNIKEFFSWLGGPEPEEDFKEVFADIKAFGNAAKQFVLWLQKEFPGLFPKPTPPITGANLGRGTVVNGPPATKVSYGPVWAPLRRTYDYLHNPGNIEGKYGLNHYSSELIGYQALASLLKRKYQGDTLSQLAYIYEGGAAGNPQHNDIPTYIKNLSKFSGFSPNQKLNMNNRTTLIKVIGAIARQEGDTPARWRTPQAIAAYLNGESYDQLLSQNQKDAQNSANFALNVPGTKALGSKYQGELPISPSAHHKHKNAELPKDVVKYLDKIRGQLKTKNAENNNVPASDVHPAVYRPQPHLTHSMAVEINNRTGANVTAQAYLAASTYARPSWA